MHPKVPDVKPLSFTDKVRIQQPEFVTPVTYSPRVLLNEFNIVVPKSNTST